MRWWRFPRLVVRREIAELKQLQKGNFGPSVQ